jgi:hypothetical protein
MQCTVGQVRSQVVLNEGGVYSDLASQVSDMVRLSDPHFYITSHKGGCHRKGGRGFSGLILNWIPTVNHIFYMYKFIWFYNFKTILLGQKEVQKSRGFSCFSVSRSRRIHRRALRVFSYVNCRWFFWSKCKSQRSLMKLCWTMDWTGKYVGVTAPLSLYFMKNDIFLQSMPSKEIYKKTWC